MHWTPVQTGNSGFGSTRVRFYQGLVLPGFCPTRVWSYPGSVLPSFGPTPVRYYSSSLLPGFGTTRVRHYPVPGFPVHVFIGMRKSEQKIFNRDFRYRVGPNPGSSGSMLPKPLPAIEDPGSSITSKRKKFSEGSSIMSRLFSLFLIKKVFLKT